MIILGIVATNSIREAFLALGNLLHSKIQMASTMWLLFGRHAGDPPNKKHLEYFACSNYIRISHTSSSGQWLYVPFYTSQTSLMKGRSRARGESERPLVIFIQFTIYTVLGLFWPPHYSHSDQ